MENIQTYIGYAAGIFGLIPFVMIAISMKKGETKPNLAGWIIYTVAMAMIVLSSIVIGAWQAVWLAMAYIVGQSLVISLSFRTGYFAFSRFDYIALSISFLSVVLWISTNDPIYALVLNVLVDAMGTFAILHKLYLHSGTESTKAWTMASFVALLNIFAITSFDVSHALYPIYLVFANALIAALSFRKNK